MKRCLVLVALSGCFGDFAGGGTVTHQAPAPPSGDGFYGRLGVELGWGNLWRMVQASGDVEWIGDVSAAGGAARATVFLEADEYEHGIEGVGISARVSWHWHRQFARDRRALARPPARRDQYG